MPRQFKGAHEANIPIDDIMKECAAWADDIVDAVGKELLKETRKNANTAFSDRSGKLRKSIKRKKSRLDKDTHIVGAFWPTAHLIEFGHDVKVKKGGQVLGHAPARPFLGPAKDAVAGNLHGIIKRAVGDITIEVKK